MPVSRIYKLAISLSLPFLAGLIGSLSTAPAISAWYVYINKPSWNPPNWLFGPVWTTLYVLMGISLFIVWDKVSDFRSAKKILAVFAVQLVLNTAWSLIFFGARSPFWSLMEIALLILAIIWNMLVFYRISRPAPWLLAPYLAWVIFASYLNYTILTLN